MLTDDLLWDYTDGFLDSAEKIQVEAYLGQHPEQMVRLESIMTQKRAFKGLNLEVPAEGFAKQVMAAWAMEKAAAPVKANGRDWVLWGIFVSFGLMLIIPFLLVPASSEATLQIPQEYLPQIQLPMVDWAGLFSSALLRNALLLTLAFMLLKLFDRYLQVRKMHLVG